MSTWHPSFRMIALSHGSQVFGAFEKYRLSIDMIASSEVREIFAEM